MHDLFVITNHGYDYKFFYDPQDVMRDQLTSFIRKRMKKYKIKKVMVTCIKIWRRHLITKERMERYCKGNALYEKVSANDDIESLFGNLRLGKAPDDNIGGYFLPKLTKEELKLVELKDHNFMQTFQDGMNADVNKAEMMLSESNSKFVRGHYRRFTFTIENESNVKASDCCILQ